MPEHIAVIGGGLSGTAAAHTLVECGYDVTIIERQNRIGGRVHSEIVDGAAVEMGAGFLTPGYTNTLDFMTETGLDRCLYQQNDSSATGIYHDGSVRMVTPGALLGNKPLSWGAKSHALSLLLKTLTSWRQLDPHAFWEADRYDNRSVADMFQTGSGKEFLENALQPALDGYFYWTPEHTSEAILRVLCKAAFSHGTYNMKGGLQRIPERAAEGSNVLLEHTVKRVAKTNDDTYDITVDHRGDEQMVRADGVICATTATAVPEIFPDLSERQRIFFKAIHYSSAALIARTYRQEETHGSRAIAFPRREGVGLAAVTLAPHPVTGDTAYATIKTYASGSIAAQFANQSDDALCSTLVAKMEPVRDLLLVDDLRPMATHVQRWPEALPYFDVGHLKRLRQFENGIIEDQSQPVTFAGDYIGGPFMEGAFTSGVRAAQRLIDRLQ